MGSVSFLELRNSKSNFYSFFGEKVQLLVKLVGVNRGRHVTLKYYPLKGVLFYQFYVKKDQNRPKFLFAGTKSVLVLFLVRACIKNSINQVFLIQTFTLVGPTRD